MRELFGVGYERAIKGYQWAKVPPGYTAPQIEPPVETQPAVPAGRSRSTTSR